MKKFSNTYKYMYIKTGKLINFKIFLVFPDIEQKMKRTYGMINKLQKMQAKNFEEEKCWRI